MRAIAPNGNSVSFSNDTPCGLYHNAQRTVVSKIGIPFVQTDPKSRRDLKKDQLVRRAKENAFKRIKTCSGPARSVHSMVPNSSSMR